MRSRQRMFLAERSASAPSSKELPVRGRDFSRSLKGQYGYRPCLQRGRKDPPVSPGRTSDPGEKIKFNLVNHRAGRDPVNAKKYLKREKEEKKLWKKTAVLYFCAAMMLLPAAAHPQQSTHSSSSCACGVLRPQFPQKRQRQLPGDAQKLVLSTYGLQRRHFRRGSLHRLENEFNPCEIVTETGGTNDRYTKLAQISNSTIDVIELSQAMTAKGTAGLRIRST